MEAQEIPTKSRDEYKRLQHIGRGTYGDVFLCEVAETEERVCMKEVDVTFLPSDDRMRCLHEVALLKQLPRHPSIVGFRDAFWAECAGSSAQVLVLILEYADGGDLENYLRSLDGSSMPDEEARRIFLQLVQAIHHLHRHRVVHRDLKCGNVFLFRSGRVVLGDFGSSKRLPPKSGSELEREAQGFTSTVVGSPFYMSPEMLEGEPHGFATDIWSLGCVLYEVVSGGRPAFAAPSYPAVVYRITQGTYDPLDPTAAALEVRNLVDSMLQKDPQMRPSIAEILQTSWLGALAESLDLESSPQREMNADQRDLRSNTEKQGSVPPTSPVDSSISIQVSASKQTFLLPPPAPAGIAGPSRARIHRVQRPRREANHVRDPLIRLDVDPPPPVLPPTSKHHRPQQHVIPAQTLSGLEIRGVRITRTARLQQPRSAPKPHKVPPQ